MGGTSTRMPTARTKATTSEVISNLVEQLTTTVNNVNKKTTELLQDGKEFSAYLLNEEEMTGLKIVCEDASTCMQYLRHRINPRTDRKEVCLMPENWRHHDEKNNWNLRERTQETMLDLFENTDTTFYWGKENRMAHKESLFDLAAYALEQQSKQNMLQTIQHILYITWWQRARDVIEKVSGDKNLPGLEDKKTILSMVMTAFEVLQDIQKRCREMGPKKWEKSEMFGQKIELLKELWAKADAPGAEDKLRGLYAEKLANHWLKKIKETIGDMDAKNPSEFYPFAIFAKMTARLPELKKELLEKFDEDAFDERVPKRLRLT